MNDKEKLDHHIKSINEALGELKAKYDRNDRAVIGVCQTKIREFLLSTGNFCPWCGDKVNECKSNPDFVECFNCDYRGPSEQDKKEAKQ